MGPCCRVDFVGLKFQIYEKINGRIIKRMYVAVMPCQHDWVFSVDE